MIDREKTLDLTGLSVDREFLEMILNALNRHGELRIINAGRTSLLALAAELFTAKNL